MKNEKALTEMENLFMALSDKTRLRLLNLMRGDEICVCFFVEVLGESQPKISRQLAYLRNTGIVETRREGKWMHYKIVEPENKKAAEILRNTLDWLCSKEEMRIEYETLAEACYSLSVPATIIRAPKPETFGETNINIGQFKEKEELETFLL